MSDDSGPEQAPIEPRDKIASGNAPDKREAFRAVLYPHRSLGPTGFLILMSAIGGVSFIVNPVFLQGVDAFGSNVQHSQFSAAAIFGTATANLTDSLSAKLLFNAQYAFNTLPAAMLVNYGGETFGRGFEPGAIHGNSAVLGALELAQKIDTKLSWLPGFSLCTFVDYGAVWNPPELSVYEYASLSSIGFGIRTGVGQHLVASGFVVQPLGYNVQLAALGLDQSLKLRFTLGLRF